MAGQKGGLTGRWGGKGVEQQKSQRNWGPFNDGMKKASAKALREMGDHPGRRKKKEKEGRQTGRRGYKTPRGRDQDL